jgi:hypothetical protein
MFVAYGPSSMGGAASREDRVDREVSVSSSADRWDGPGGARRWDDGELTVPSPRAGLRFIGGRTSRDYI